MPLGRVPVRPLAGLSPIELEGLLERSMQYLRSDPPERLILPPQQGVRTTYHWSPTFLRYAQEARRNVPEEALLGEPQVIIGRGGASYNAHIVGTIEERLDGFCAQPLDRRFSQMVAKDWAWIRDQQLSIVRYLAEHQRGYLQSGQFWRLQYLGMNDVARALGHDESSVSRFMRNLTVQLPEDSTGGDVIFCSALSPGKSYQRMVGIAAVRDLKKDPLFYSKENGRWLKPDSVIRKELCQRYGIDVQRRAVSTYRSAA